MHSRSYATIFSRRQRAKDQAKTSEYLVYSVLGYEVSIRFAYKGAFHCHIKFPRLLHLYQLSGHKEAKLLIKLNTEKQAYTYDRNYIELNKVGVQTTIRAVPLSLLGSQKLAAIMGRKRPKGRDFYDLVWILKRTGLNYGYLNEKLNVDDDDALRSLVTARIEPFSFDQLAEDVRPFLFQIEDVDSVRHFPAYWQTVPLPAAT